MTRYDIRLRRKALSKGRIERHKDFKSLSQMQPRQRPDASKRRLIVIILAAVIVLFMIGLGVQRLIEDRKDLQEAPADVFEEFKE